MSRLQRSLRSTSALLSKILEFRLYKRKKKKFPLFARERMMVIWERTVGRGVRKGGDGGCVNGTCLLAWWFSITWTPCSHSLPSLLILWFQPKICMRFVDGTTFTSQRYTTTLDSKSNLASSVLYISFFFFFKQSIIYMLMIFLWLTGTGKSHHIYGQQRDGWEKEEERITPPTTATPISTKEVQGVVSTSTSGILSRGRAAASQPRVIDETIVAAVPSEEEDENECCLSLQLQAWDIILFDIIGMAWSFVS